MNNLAVATYRIIWTPQVFYQRIDPRVDGRPVVAAEGFKSHLR